MSAGLSRTARLLRSKIVWALLGVGAVALAVGLVLFEPWKLWVDSTVDEALPAAAAPVAVPVAVVAPSASPASAPPAAAPGPVSTEPTVELRGALISHEHDTAGTVAVLRLADGSRVLRFTDLDTSNGPDLKVVLSDAKVLPGRAGWHVFDDGVHRKIGNLKGNKGSQNYTIPADVDLGDFRSVSIWCDRFNVSFGASELRPA